MRVTLGPMHEARAEVDLVIDANGVSGFARGAGRPPKPFATLLELLSIIEDLRIASAATLPATVEPTIGGADGADPVESSLGSSA